MDELVGDALERHASEFARTAGEPGTLHELSAFAGAYVRFAADEPVVARVLQQHGTSTGDDAPHARAFLEDLVDRVDRIVREGDLGGSAERRHAVTALLVATILGLGDLVSRADGLAIHVDVAQAALARLSEVAPALADAL